MKRYRVLTYDFDSRANILNTEILEDWEPTVKLQWERNKNNVRERLIGEFGSFNAFEKIDNFARLGGINISLIAFHNNFFRQIRDSYVIGAYYPALTGACALGERILNHLILRLRDYFKSTKEYKTVYRKDSFDNWDLAINSLESWGVLLPEVVVTFKDLKNIRNSAIHFNPETDTNVKELTDEAIDTLNKIIHRQFSGFGTQPWYIEGTRGSCYVKRSYEEDPFVKEIVLPNCQEVGHLHLLERSPQGGFVVIDDHDYGFEEITDEEFCKRINDPNRLKNT